MDKTISRRLDALQQIANRNRPCKMTVTFADGSTTVTDPAGVWTVCHDHMLSADVVDVTADRPEYSGLAGLITVLCHPVPNRRIEDFESSH